MRLARNPSSFASPAACRDIYLELITHSLSSPYPSSYGGTSWCHCHLNGIGPSYHNETYKEALRRTEVFGLYLNVLVQIKVKIGSYRSFYAPNQSYRLRMFLNLDITPQITGCLAGAEPGDSGRIQKERYHSLISVLTANVISAGICKQHSREPSSSTRFLFQRLDKGVASLCSLIYLNNIKLRTHFP